ncbi:FG-GAP-like repeat-containing protein [Reichenbachiella sp. MALMAid0571]|uniref:FG-GAP-like repeat-containing protein n=1 Tax=Reichenbachiella sp. MALMAid0571 TaxID=3143939 RepID=UPI0032DF9619
MNIYKNTIASFILIAILLSGSKSFGQAPPYISSIDKTSGTIGETVIITGTNFSTNSADLSVKFGAVEATIVSSTANIIEVTVPSGATLNTVSVTKLSSKLTGYSNELFSIGFKGQSNVLASFDNLTTFPTGTATYDLCLCDFDGDGLSDIAVTNSESNEVFVYKNNSTPTTSSFTKVSDTDLNIGFRSINTTCGDLDGDGKSDLIVTQGGSNSNGVFVFKNTSSGTGIFAFTRIGANLAVPDLTLKNKSDGNIRTARRVEINDLDLDGKPEIILTTESDHVLDIFKNTSTSGTISFNTTPTQITLPESIITSGLDVKDLNNDGLPEIAVIHDKASDIYIVPNHSEPGTLTFDEAIRISVNGTFQNLKIGDINKDGFNDIVATDRISNKVVVLENTTTAVGATVALSLKTTITSGISQPWGLDLGDLDGDGNIDIATASTSGSNIVQIIAGNSSSDFTFFGVVNRNATSNSRNIKIGDLNGDGKPDLAFTHKVNSGLSGQLGIFMNRNCVIAEITPSGDTEICTGQNLNLEATKSGGATYTWDQDSNKDGVFDNLAVKTGADNFLDVTGTGSGKYRVTISDGLSCSEVSNIVDITISASGIAAPVASSNPASGTAVCEGTTVNLFASGSLNSYEWTGPNGYTSADQNPVLTNVTPEMTGKYIVTGRDLSGCISQAAEVTVVVETLPVIAVNNSGLDIFCLGSTAEISVTNFGSNYSYKWKQDGVDIPSQIGTTLNVTESGNYSAVITSDANGCSHESSARTLTAIPVPTNSITSDDLICEDLPLVFNAPTGDQNGQSITHSWDFGDSSPTEEGASVSHTYADAGVYTVTLTTSYTNVATCNPTVKTKQVTIQEVPNSVTMDDIVITTSTGSTEKCPSEALDLSVSDLYTNYSWFTEPGTILSTSNSLDQITDPQKGDSPVTYTMTATDAAGCDFSAEVTISLKDAAGISILYENANAPDEINLEDGQLSVDLVVDNATGITWTPEEIFDDPTAEMVTAIPNDINILVKVFGTDPNGCVESDSIRIINPIIRAKSVFSPNGDGIGAECWEITNARSKLDGCTIYIFDSKGQIIKQEAITTQADDCIWDGTHKGLLLPEGIYYYALKCVDNANVPTNLSGSILLGR